MANKRIPVNKQINDYIDTWDRIEKLVTGDDKAVRSLAKKLPGESQAAYDDRVKFYDETFVNISSDILSAPIEEVFKNGLKEEYENGTPLLNKFAEDVTLGGDTVSYRQYLRNYIAPALFSYGTVAIVVDKKRYQAVSLQDELENGQLYLSMLRMQDVINWERVDNEFVWFAYKTTHCDPWYDPINDDQPEAIDVQCIWTRTDFIKIDMDGNLIEQFTHNWGVVPVVVYGTHLKNTNDIIGKSSFFDTSKMIITAGNLFNCGVYELYKHARALLLMNRDSMGAANFGEDSNGNGILKKTDKDGILPYEGDVPPAYLIKELAEDRMFMRAEMYLQKAIENERDAKSVIKKGMDGGDIQESGVAKALDHSPMETSLIAKAEDLEHVTYRLFDLACMIANESPDNYMFEFDKDFDLAPLRDKFEDIKLANDPSVKLKDFSETAMRELYKNIAPKITKQADVLKTVYQEIEDADFDEFDKEILDKMAAMPDLKTNFGNGVGNKGKEEQEKEESEAVTK